jgi:HSP20 family protein
MSTKKELEGRFPILDLRRELEEPFEDFFGGRAFSMPEGWSEPALPAMEVRETEQAIQVDAEMPGLEKADIDVRVEGGMLTISGVRKQESEEKTKAFHRSERFYGRMERSLLLPVEVESDKIEAKYKDGVLKLVIPKKAVTRPKGTSIRID